MAWGSHVLTGRWFGLLGAGQEVLRSGGKWWEGGGGWGVFGLTCGEAQEDAVVSSRKEKAGVTATVLQQGQEKGESG